MSSLIYAWTNGWANNPRTGDLRSNRAHCVVTIMIYRTTKMSVCQFIYDWLMKHFLIRWPVDSTRKGPVKRKSFHVMMSSSGQSWFNMNASWYGNVCFILGIEHFRGNQPVTIGFPPKCLGIVGICSFCFISLNMLFKLLLVWDTIKLMWRHSNHWSYHFSWIAQWSQLWHRLNGHKFILLFLMHSGISWGVDCVIITLTFKCV